MQLDKEKKLQRILQTITAVTLVLILIVLAKGLGFSFVDFFDDTQTSVIEIPPQKTQNKKIKRPENPPAAVRPTQSRVKPKSAEKDQIQMLIESLSLTPSDDAAQDENFQRHQEKAAKNPKDPSQYHVLANLAFIQKDYKTAEEYYDLAFRLKPSDTRLLLGFIRSLINQRKFFDAKEKLEKQKLQENEQALLLYKGLIAALLDEKESALTGLESAKNGNDPVINDPVIAKKAEAVLNAYEEFSFTTDGKQEHLKTLLAKAFDEIGEYQMAIAAGLDAIKIKDDYRDGWIILGHAYLAEGQYSNAEASLMRAITLDSGNAFAYFYLSLAKGALGDHRETIKFLEKAEDLGLDGGELATMQKAKSFDALNDFENAYDWYVKTISLKKERALPVEYVRPIFIAIEKLNAPEKAGTLSALNFSYHAEKAESYNLLGWTSLALKKYNDAKKYLEKALRMNPELAAAYYNLGNMYSALGNSPLAESHFERALEIAQQKNDKSIEQASRNKLNSLKTPL